MHFDSFGKASILLLGLFTLTLKAYAESSTGDSPTHLATPESTINQCSLPAEEISKEFVNKVLSESGILFSLNFQQLSGKEPTHPHLKVLEASENEADSEELSYLEKSFAWFVDHRNNWSSTIGDLGRQIDGFFADPETVYTENKSFVKIGFFNVWRKIEGLDPEPRFKFRLDLPHTRKKLKLVIENEPDETISLSEQNRQNVLRKNETTDSSSTGFLRILSVFQEWKLKTDIGVRLRNPPDTFIRGRASKRWPISDNWQFRLSESISYFHSEGFGHSSKAFFESKLSDDLFFRSKTEAQWLKRDDAWEFAEILTLSHVVTEDKALSYRIGWLSESRPTPRTSSYYTNITYRQKLYEDWLFLEVTPELLFPRDDDFKPNPSLTFGIEVIFSE